MQGLRTKTNTFIKAVAGCDIDIISVTESWLIPSINDEELFTSKYSVYRCKRSASNSVKTLGGGVMIAVDMKYPSEKIIFPNGELIEIICVKVSLRAKAVWIVCLYIPPGSTVETYRMHEDAVDFVADRQNANDIFLVCGDFNFPSVDRKIDWVVDDEICNALIPIGLSSDCISNMVDSFFGNGLYQINNVKNSRNVLLDLFFCNNIEDIFKYLRKFFKLSQGKHPS